MRKKEIIPLRNQKLVSADKISNKFLRYKDSKLIRYNAIIA